MISGCMKPWQIDSIMARICVRKRDQKKTQEARELEEASLSLLVIIHLHKKSLKALTIS